MNNPPAVPAPPRKRVRVQPPEVLAEPKPRKRTRRTPRKASAKRSAFYLKYKPLLIGLEIMGLVISAVSAIIVLLGYSANWFSGTGFFSNLLPFALGVLVIVMATSGVMLAWWKLRKFSLIKAPYLSPSLAVCLALGMSWYSVQDSYSLAFGHFRTLVGGKHEAERITLAHQVFAAYRRYNPMQLQKMVVRAEPFNPHIEDAAKEFELDANLLQGIAAAESSFLPRDSFDGGHGLFQITLVPQVVMDEASQMLDSKTLSLDNPRHNAFIAAATLKHYLADMHDDLFLGLLAYNIGPKNGGLRFIMQQYGVKDFVTIQPYLQQLPRDYPIRVLSYALAFRLWQKEGKLLEYEEGHNATRIQRIGIPGL